MIDGIMLVDAICINNFGYLQSRVSDSLLYWRILIIYWITTSCAGYYDWWWIFDWTAILCPILTLPAWWLICQRPEGNILHLAPKWTLLLELNTINLFTVAWSVFWFWVEHKSAPQWPKSSDSWVEYESKLPRGLSPWWLSSQVVQGRSYHPN